MAIYILQVEITGMGSLYDALVVELSAMPVPFPPMPPEIARLRPPVKPYPTTVSQLRIENTTAPFDLLGPISAAPNYEALVTSRIEDSINYLEFSGGNRNTIDMRDIYISGTGTYVITFQVI